jgi:hypothetical protein
MRVKLNSAFVKAVAPAEKDVSYMDEQLLGLEPLMSG